MYNNAQMRFFSHNIIQQIGPSPKRINISVRCIAQSEIGALCNVTSARQSGHTDRH